MRPTRILAVAVSAVLGGVLGVIAGVALDRGPQDPLGLDASMVNQQCQPNKALLLLASSDNSNGLGFALAGSPDARYLETGNSCHTAWREAGKQTEAYVVYLGPFSVGTACEMQMMGEHRGDHVTLLTSGTPDTVQCLCHVAWQGMPTLRPGQLKSDREVVSLHALQGLLTAMGRRPDVAKTDVYGPQTATEVRSFQQSAGRPQTGVVDGGTWQALQKRGCDRL